MKSALKLARNLSMKPALAGALALAGGPALAHPHGGAECKLGLRMEAGAPVAMQVRLRLDAVTSSLLARRLQLSAEQPEAAALQARQVMSGLMRRAGWMVDLRPAGQPPSARLTWEESAPATWSLASDGRVLVDVALHPEAPVAAGAQWALSCADPDWYWQGAFDAEAPLQTTGAACRWAAVPRPSRAVLPATAAAAAAAASAAITGSSLAPAGGPPAAAAAALGSAASAASAAAGPTPTTPQAFATPPGRPVPLSFATPFGGQPERPVFDLVAPVLTVDCGPASTGPAS